MDHTNVSTHNHITLWHNDFSKNIFKNTNLIRKNYEIFLLYFCYKKKRGEIDKDLCIFSQAQDSRAAALEGKSGSWPVSCTAYPSLDRNTSPKSNILKNNNINIHISLIIK